MKFNRILWLIFAFVLFIPEFGDAQISQGGTPLKTGILKSTKRKLIEMPPVSNFLSIDETPDILPAETMLKPFKFAYPFIVDLSPENSGEWFKGENEYHIWKLTIRSAGAKSLNLIFDEFNIPENARLFLYNQNENHLLGAFTGINNKICGKFAVSPVFGDEVTVQYEVPETGLTNKPFKITQVNHDYIGIVKSGERRPLNKIAGVCNIDVNCDTWESWSEVKNSVCRLIINGIEICTGVLLNNTAENQKPYILSAAHCYDKINYPAVTVYTFNYESPFCAALDGDPSNSISGAVMKAQFDSLDFALVELSLIPPPDFRPYYAGWNRSTTISAPTVSIHHPLGDIKKLAVDKDQPVISSFGEPSYIDKNYVKNGFLRINRWDEGVTESGSSGGPLFDSEKKVIGTLTGGEAVCSKPVNDFYKRFSLAWAHKTDSNKQLKYWLDPLNTGAPSLSGKQFNTGANLCGAFTNLIDSDKYEVLTLRNSNQFAGYWGGSNNVGITEIMECFSIEGNEILKGVSFGVAKFKKVLKSNESEINVKVYNGNDLPEKLIHSQAVKISGFAQDAMNFIKFDNEVRPGKTFFIGFELSKIQPLDSFVVYQSLRKTAGENNFYYKQNGSWYNYKNWNSFNVANVFELVACNIDDFSADTPLVDLSTNVVIYPNPSRSTFSIESNFEMNEELIDVFNLLGQKTKIKSTMLNSYKVEIDLTGNVPGVYFVRVNSAKGIISRKISFVPW